MRIHTKMMTPLRSRVPKILALSVLAASCTDGGPPTGVDDLRPQAGVTVIYEAGEGSQFAFLQPLVKGEAQGAFATGLSPLIVVCNVTSLPPTDCMELEGEEQDGYYQANWRDRTAEPFETYSIEVFTSVGLQIGALELFLDGEQGDRAGRTFPIQFWIGQGLGDAVEATEDCVGDDRCNADYVPPPSSPSDPPLIITTENENGAIMAQLTFPPEAIPPGGIVVILDCRVGGFDPGDGPLPTLLNQWPLFCTVTASNPDGSPFTGELPGDATIDVCVVDETEPDQPPYHGFISWEDLLLGKSNAPADFVLLPPAPTALSECDGNTTIPPEEAGLGHRILRELDERFAPAFSLIMPEGLRAAPMYFRDGGVGGLVRSFSDINPVEPAYIEGTITHPSASSHVSAPLAGVTVTLSGDADDVTTTDANGFYSFGPLAADAPSGSDYTVTVSGLPAGEALSDPDIDVTVTASGTTTVDFETELADGYYFYGVTGNYYTSFATPVPWNTANSNANALPAFRTCGSQLVSILSAGEDAFIVANMPQAAQAGLPGSSGQGGYWLGGFQQAASQGGEDEPSGGWEWVSGGSIPAPGSEFAGYENWASGEPNNALGGPGEQNENSLHYLGDWSLDPAQKVRWNDEPGNRSYGYVVEFVCPGLPM